MDSNKIIEHLVEISKGECSITEAAILKMTDEDEQRISLGLLTLFEEVEFNKRQLINSNKEKEILLKEIHHRVKNNLQIISSLLKLQNMFIDDIKAKTLVMDSRIRVNTMSMIHEKLYQSKDLGSVDYSEYLAELTDQLIEAHSSDPAKVKIDLDVVSVKLCLDTAIPLGLLTNEILTNSLKYGSSGNGKDEIYLSLHQQEPKKFEMRIGDNGPGYDTEIFTKGEQSLGVQLIRDLTEQLNGTVQKLNPEGKSGTHYHIVFEEV